LAYLASWRFIFSYERFSGRRRCQSVACW
jgi:hypothetical protein